jgi:hypothetical protein
MNRITLRQLWKQRRTNGWILAELIIVTFFLWGAIDPIYVYISNDGIADGHDLSDTYLMKFGEYAPTHRLYNKEADNDSIREIDFERMLERVSQYPGVTTAAIALNYSYPQSGSWRGQDLLRDTIAKTVQIYTLHRPEDYFRLFRMKLSNGKPVESLPVTNDEGIPRLYITRNVTEKLFPNGDAVGSKIFIGYAGQEARVAGVIGDIQTRSNQQPDAICFMPQRDLRGYKIGNVQYCFRVRDGLASPAFAEKFKKEMRPQLQIGNFYMTTLQDFDAVSKNYEFIMGVTGKLRLQMLLCSFFIFCTFLGLSGTFWLRTNARKVEIGIRMAMGSSRTKVRNQFLGEAFILTTAGFLIGLFFVLQRVIANGFADTNLNGSQAYLQNQAVPHFLIVSAITWLLLLLTAALATWIPAARAAKTQPTEALRDE